MSTLAFGHSALTDFRVYTFRVLEEYNCMMLNNSSSNKVNH